MRDKNYEFYADTIQEIIEESKIISREKWLGITLDHMLELTGRGARLELSQDEIQECIALQLWVERTLQDGIKFQEMIQNASQL